nr:hypothetical protein Iba_chr09bCG9600 [Ipomoea batatas]
MPSRRLSLPFAVAHPPKSSLRASAAVETWHPLPVTAIANRHVHYHPIGRGRGRNIPGVAVMLIVFRFPEIAVALMGAPRKGVVVTGKLPGQICDSALREPCKGRHINLTVEFATGGGPVELPQSRTPVTFSVICLNGRLSLISWAVDGGGVTAMIAMHTNTKRVAEE